MCGVTLGTIVLLPAAELPLTDEIGGASRSSNIADEIRLANLRRELAAELLTYGVSVLLIPAAEPTGDGLDYKTATAHWIAHNAASITAALPEQPILLVALGPSGALLPALGFSSRASRRRVAGYVVIDGDLPKMGTPDWPDAPVTVVTTTAASAATVAEAATAKLRGWTVEPDADPGAVLRALFAG